METPQKEYLLKQIIEKHDSMIRGVVLRRIERSNPEWEDIIQNIYLSIWIALDRFKKESMIGSYIYPIVNCRISDYLRTLYKRKKVIDRILKSNLESIKPYYGRNGKSLNEREEEIKKEKNIRFLSPAEFRVFKLIGQGKTNDEIVDSLFISKDTMKSHNHKIRLKLGFNNRTKLALFAYRFLNGGIR